jgi:hypothetical protein
MTVSSGFTYLSLVQRIVTCRVDTRDENNWF